ncbi:unnamed protein product [Knipowitschia caucasica]
MLGTLTEQEKAHWKDQVKPLVHAYNCTKNDSTGFSPYELMFGRQPRLPVDLAFGLPLNEDKSNSHLQYVQKLKSHLEDSYKLAMENSHKLMERNKVRFDRHVTASELNIGDRVLVRNIRLRGKHKLADKWEADVYIVVKKADDLPVYTVRPEGKEKPLCTLHRDLLLACGYLPSRVERSPVKKRSPAPPPLTSILPAPAEESNDDLPVYVPLSFEPVKFTNLYDLPVAQPPAPAASPVLPVIPAPLPCLVPQDSPESEVEKLVDGSGMPVAEEILADGNDDPEFLEPQRIDLADDLPVDDGTLSASPDRLIIDPVPDLHVTFELPNPEPERDIRRSGRTRNPPERLQYSKLGHPLLKSIQTLLHGLSTAFTFAVQGEEDYVPSLEPCQSTIRCQPGPCPRTDMG